MKIGVQELCNQLKKLDSGFRRNDKKWCFSTFYEVVIYDILDAKRAKAVRLKAKVLNLVNGK